MERKLKIAWYRKKKYVIFLIANIGVIKSARPTILAVNALHQFQVILCQSSLSAMMQNCSYYASDLQCDDYTVIQSCLWGKTCLGHSRKVDRQIIYYILQQTFGNMQCAGAQICLCCQLFSLSLLFHTVLTCSFLLMHWVTIVQSLLSNSQSSCKLVTAEEAWLFNPPKLRFPGSQDMSVQCSTASHTVIEASDALN